MGTLSRVGSVLALPFKSCVSYLPTHLGKVTRVALPVLAALAAVSVAFYCYRSRVTRPRVPQETPPPPVPKQIVTPPVVKDLKVQPLSQLGAEAIAHVKALLSSRGRINELVIVENSHSTGGEIEKIATLYEEKYGALKKLTNSKEIITFWQDPEVLNLADECVVFGFAMSILTLRELNRFWRTNKQENLESLTDLRYYKSHAILQCARIYRFLRYCYPLSGERKFTIHHSHKIPEALSTPFYTQGTLQYKWRALYNEVRTQLEMYVDKEELEKTESLHKWTKQDDTSESYDAIPKRLPWSEDD